MNLLITFCNIVEFLYSWKDLIEILSYLATIIGIPIAILVYSNSTKKDEEDKDYLAYNSLDEKYTLFLNLCLQYPQLDVFDVQKNNSRPLVKGDESNDYYQEVIILTMLITILERAYILSINKSSQFRLHQWIGWKSYIEEWAKRENFKYVWRELDGGFDERFTKFMDKLI